MIVDRVEGSGAFCVCDTQDGHLERRTYFGYSLEESVIAFRRTFPNCDGRKVVSLVFDEDGNFYDECWNWETGQNYALSGGYRVVAIADDGRTDKETAQRLYDAERDRYRDCFGLTS